MMTDGVLKTYEISQLEVTDKPELKLLSNSVNKDSLILTTCWPFQSLKSGSQRYLLHAKVIKKYPV